MKQLRLFLAATVLILSLISSTFAGDMDTTVTSQTLSVATAAGDMQTTVAGNMETGITANEATDADSPVEIALYLIQSVLSLF